jgi:hypothetical protein
MYYMYSSELLTFLLRGCYVWWGLLRILLVEVPVDLRCPCAKFKHLSMTHVNIEKYEYRHSRKSHEV